MTTFPELKDASIEDVNKMVDKQGVVMERKVDGTAAVVHCHEEIFIEGRGQVGEMNQDYTYKFPEIVEATNWIQDDCVLLGEIAVYPDGGEDENFQLLQTRVNRKNDILEYSKKYPATFVAFDILEFEGISLMDRPFKERRKILECLFLHMEDMTNGLRIAEQAGTREYKEDMLDRMELGSWEGVVLKDLSATYATNQYRYKRKATYDVYTYGEVAKWGEGKYNGLVGSVICYQVVNGREMEIGNVGGGFNIPTRKTITERILSGEISKDSPEVWIIQSHEVLNSGKFRYPNYVETRYDKAPHQCIRIHNPQPTKLCSDSSLDKWT